jgi:hypothetical protein
MLDKVRCRPYLTDRNMCARQSIQSDADIGWHCASDLDKILQALSSLQHNNFPCKRPANTGYYDIVIRKKFMDSRHRLIHTEARAAEVKRVLSETGAGVG